MTRISPVVELSLSSRVFPEDTTYLHRHLTGKLRKFSLLYPMEISIVEKFFGQLQSFRLDDLDRDLDT
jgi:hypothetical protein